MWLQPEPMEIKKKEKAGKAHHGRKKKINYWF